MTSIGFGFFHKARTRAKNRKSERQMADMQAAVAIQGSIQHIWGETSPVAPALVSEEKTMIQSRMNQDIDHVEDNAPSQLFNVEPPLQKEVDSLPDHTIRNRFSFCPSTISLTSTPHKSQSISSSNVGDPEPVNTTTMLTTTATGIYVPVMPDAVRDIDAYEDESSCSGLSEVNYRSGSSDSSSIRHHNERDQQGGEEGVRGEQGGKELKRVSYTKLSSSEYLLAQSVPSSRELEKMELLRRLSLQNNSRVKCVLRQRSVRSDDSAWSVEREVIHGGI